MNLDFVTGSDATKFSDMELVSSLELKSGMLKRSLAFVKNLEM